MRQNIGIRAESALAGSRWYWAFIALLAAPLLVHSPPADAQVFSSDDFSGPSLDLSLWTPVDPIGDGSFSVSNGALSISVGAGVQHDVWLSGNDSARVMQPTDDVDFEIETKFSSLPNLQHQLQGILIEQDANNFIRFDFYSGDFSLHAFAATFTNGSPTVQRNSVVQPSGPEGYLRITRSQDQWTLSLSFDGSSWTTFASFSHTITVSSVGVFAGNAGPAAPAFTSVVDYVFNTASPIDPEDGVGGDPGPDITPPVIFGESAVAISDTEIRVSWNTNENADSTVEYGLTTAYELGTVSGSGFSSSHDLVIDNLTPDQTYHFRASSTDAAGNTSASGDLVADTSALPTIDVWYGDTQTFGLLGDPQWAANILGNVSDPDGISSLSYSLNGSPSQPLTVGPDGSRLENSGDFNIELQYDDLAVGSNSVEIVAIDGAGLQNTRTVIVNYAGPNVWPSDYSIDWSAYSSISDAAQVVDGKWALESDSVRPVEMGYDRLIAFGDDTWQNYEVTAEITVHGLDPLCSQTWCAGGRPLVGILARWPGHYYWGSLPNDGWYPMGSLVVMSWDPNTGSSRLEAFKGSVGSIGPIDLTATLSFGVPHTLKVRAETVAGAQRYSAKIWRSDQPEPTPWNLVLDEPLSATSSGSAMLVAHHVDVSFGDVSVTALGAPSPGDTTPPSITGIQVSNITSNSATVTWQTNEPATSLVRYGESLTYELGTQSSASLVTSHAITLTGLDPDTQYNIQVSSADGSGNTSDSENLVIVTDSGAPPATGVVSDGFEGPLNTSIWSVDDPLGDSNVSTTGTQLAISVPGGTAHDVWANSNHAPRVVQAVSDGDFEVEVKFDSAVTEQYQLQGLLFEQDSANLVRFDFYSEASQTHAFAATFSNGSPSVRRDIIISGGSPIYMRVTRTGDTWTYRYSYDGANWLDVVSFVHAINVSSVGVFAGNAGSNPPAFTSLVDYFLVNGSELPDPNPDTTPPTISNVQITNVGENSATVTWDTEEPASSEVGYGTTTEYLDGVASTPGLVTSHSVELTALTASTVYHLRVSSTDTSGNQALSGDYQFVTDDPPPIDTTPPVIFNVVVSGVTANEATISWETDEPSNSAVAYGITTNYEIGQESASSLVTQHTITLTGLDPETTYHFEPSSIDSSGNSGVGGDFVFITAAAPSGPSISSDEFNGAFDSTIWDFADPIGDSTISTTGSQLAISFPGGSAHDLWVNSNDAPRVTQGIADTDFEIEVKFDSTMTQTYQIQGLIAEQDGQNLVRFDFYSEGSSTNFFAATFEGGSPTIRQNTVIPSGFPIYLRMKRQGDFWTGSYSYDGVNWTIASSFVYQATINDVGIFAGNAGPSPAHTALADYFRVIN